MASNYDPASRQSRSDVFGGRVRGVLDMLGRAGAAVSDGVRQWDESYRQWEADQQEAQENDAAAMAGAESAPRRIPDVTRKPAWRPATDTVDANAAADAAFKSATEEDFESQVRPGGKEYQEPDLELPGARPPAPRRALPTARDVQSARPESRKAAADSRAAEQKAANAEARARPQRQAAADAGVARGARQQEAREVGINADPEQVEKDRQAAVADIRKPKPKSAVQDMQEREDRAGVASDTRQYQADVARWQNDMRILETRLEDAIANGRIPEARELAAEKDRHQAAKPQPTARMRGGQTAEEIMEPVAATLAKLPPPLQQALRGHLVKQALPAGATSETAKAADRARAERIADESLVSMYDGLEPEARLAAMSEDAERVSTPATMTYGGGDESTPGGFGAGIGDNARNEDMKPADLQRSGRDLDRGFPTVNKPGQRGGTFVQNPDGRWSRRAPNPTMDQMIPGEDQLPINPKAITPEWRDAMKIAGTMLGLNPAGFDNENQFIAAAQERLARHRELSGKYDVRPVVTGGYRYTPNQATKDATQRRELAQRVENFIQMYPDAPAEELYALADAGDAQGLLAVQNAVRRGKKTERAQAARDYEVRQAHTRNINNPEVAPAMFIEDLNQAGNDPAAIAAVYRKWGMPGEGARVSVLDNQRQAAQFDNEQRRAEIDADRARAGRGDDDKPPLPKAYLDGINLIVDQALGANGQDAPPPETSINQYVMHENQYRKSTGQQPITPAQGAYDLARNVLARGAPLGHQLVSHALAQIIPTISSLRADPDEVGVGPVDDKRTTFIREARRLVVGDKFTDEELGRWFDTNFRK